MKKSLNAVGFSMFLLGSVCDADVTLLEDTFDSENSGAAALNYTGLTNWDVTSGAIDLVGNGSFDVYPGNGLYLDLEGSFHSQSGRIESKTVFNLSPGQYRLSFDLGNYSDGSPENDNIVRVSLAGVYSEDFIESNQTALLPVTRLITVGAATSGKLVFVMQPPVDNYGFVLDDVKLEFIPEPTSALLVGLGMLGALAMRRRK